MKIYSQHIENHRLANAFGRNGLQFIKGMPSRSFHLAWKDVPEEAVTLAIVFVDHDAIPVCGFSWIHWSVANIDPLLGELAENASAEWDLLEGINSFASPLLPTERRLTREEASHYGGPAPRNGEHTYTLELYALDCKLDLARGFHLNELLTAMTDHVLAKATLNMTYQ